MFSKKFSQKKTRIKNQKKLTEYFLYKLWDKQRCKCYYSKVDLSKKIKDIHSVSIDRKDNKFGYNEQNKVLCSSIINSMKNDLDIGKFKEIIHLLYNNF
ncbi:MAG: hypothetical protein KatS3mg035_1079 [Bacteroidia bacterium]|nr:MAG: hypothetical protein KatS3mg035_1079 [Bacteroidia bacterium]